MFVFFGFVFCIFLSSNLFFVMYLKQKIGGEYLDQYEIEK